MPFPTQIKGRYEIREVLGHGGMGVVYNAYDKVVKRGVALKTIRDIPSRAALDLFYKECDVLASISHPNIVEIFDIGEFEEDGASKPYFVMPLLPGKTLEQLIHEGSNRLAVGRCVEIFSQTCRGLAAAHDRGLVHRDLKPSNIFVMDDDSVKIIDFGVAHMADTKTTIGHKGTLLYMAPEQVEMKPASALSDIFSFGVVCFETLTLRHPFERGNAGDVATAILKYVPPPISELNPGVNAMISRVIHKAIAKQPWYRFANAREMAETLQKASRNEPIEMFDASRIQPRIQRAAKAFEQGDAQFADEILTELEAEGNVDASVSALRRQIDQAQRQKMIAQLLESARRRVDEEEYPLALQKLHELLALDPSNGPALALKNDIENRRSARKIEDWFRLARQHLEQNAFGHARQALQNVLELKPRDTRALQLVSEVDRREQDFIRIRQEKEQLYAKAMEAWQGGDVSVALSKLERLVEIDRAAPDTAASDRSASFQNFYNEVRSEHDAIKSGYDQARKHLMDGNFDAALAICNDQLARHPGQALFQALKLDVEERQRQELSARIAEVDRQVEAEPDLEKRVSLLTEALEQHPGEAHFERMLRTTRDKRDLVSSIVSKARSLEEREQFSDALAQWEILKTIYSQYPGLDFEIERTRKRRDQQVRAEAKAKWIEQIDWQLGAGEYQRARELLESAQSEYPGDSELAELDKLASQGLARAEDARKLLAEGQALCQERRFEEGISVLNRAYELDPKNTSIRAALTGTLVEQARGKLEEDWRAADTLAQQALELDSSNAQAKSLRALALDRKREEFVDSCVAQARRYQSDGQFEAALQQVENGLAEFPRESRLTQLRATLTKAYAETQTMKGATRATQATVAADASIRALPTETVAMPLGQTVPPAAAPPPAERPLAETAALPSLAETVALPAPPAAAETPSAEPPAPSPQTAATRPPSPAPPRPKPPNRTPLIVGVLGVVAVLAAGLVVIPKLLKKAPPPSPVETAPAAAAPVEAPPAPPPNATVRVLADLEGGKVTLDDNPIGDLQDGQISLENLAPGKHSLKIAAPHGQATIALDAEPGAAPNVESLAANEVIAVTVAGMGARAKVQSSAGSARLAVDGKAAGQTGPTGLDLNDLSPGNHEFTVGEGKDLRSMVVGIGTAPMLTVFLKSDRNAGTLVLVTGEDGVHVFLDGKEYRRRTERGQLRISGLPVKDYAVRIFKDGFLEDPEQHASIRKGEELKLEFQMRPVPKVASLAISGAMAGAQVLLDGTAIGTVQDDGSFRDSSLSPGDHSIELRKDPYRPRKIEKRFDAGAAVQLAAADVVMEKPPSTLQVTVSPADARVTIARAGEAPRPLSGGSLTLPEGTYTLTARAPNYVDKTATVTLGIGESKEVALMLVKVATKVLGMADWDDPAGWSLVNGWYERKGGNFVLFKPAKTDGVFVFTADLRKGKKLQWVAAYADARNYLTFQMDKKYFYRVAVVNGKENQLSRVQYTVPKGNALTIEMDVASGSIIHKLYDGSKWTTIDSWSEDRQFGGGKFGFLIPGADVVAISNFSFTPK